MAGRAVNSCLYVVLLDKFFPERHLVSGRHIRHVKDLIFGTDIRGRIPVATDAPVHLQRLAFGRQGHLINLSMACGASDPLGDVNTMVKVDKVR